MIARLALVAMEKNTLHLILTAVMLSLFILILGIIHLELEIMAKVMKEVFILNLEWPGKRCSLEKLYSVELTPHQQAMPMRM